DWTFTGSMNLLRELRCADGFNQSHFGGFFSDEQLWLMVTKNAASLTATDDAIGALAVGLVADLAVFDGRARADYRAVVGAEPSDVVLVLRGAKALYGDASVVGALADGCDALDVCGASKSACVASELGRNLDDLRAMVGAAGGAGAAAYPLFFCGDP